ncbi:hypothetical protein CVT25_007858 [Psilocybe cyanescens]|uniref:Uncharacterized protein n=1 Tax=Psilocybe cyanescens TaxID=93625 RepID=A0A409XR63_PSICY|nr:hypothetical protein CVT25_007858 [Psilocybe cyanescens]
MDSATIEQPPAPPNISSNDVDAEHVNDDIGPIPNPVNPNFLVRPDRHQVVYNSEERKVLDAHKERYLASKSAEEHKSVAKTYILPAIFQYWDSIGHEIGDSRTQARALGNILQCMSALQLEQLDRQGAQILSAANQDNDRRQQLAEKKAISRFSKSAKGHWNEMGVLSLSFVAYTDTSGKLVVQVVDQMAELIEVDAPLFESQYRPQVHQMKLYVMEYITKMKKILNPGPTPWAPNGTGNDVKDLNLQFDQHGFPILPQRLDTKSGNLPVKKELDEMIRKYFAKHYKLATNGQSKHVPYKQLQENQAQHKKAYKFQQKKGKSKAQNTDGQNVFGIGDILLQMSPTLDSDVDMLAPIRPVVDKGKEKAIGPDSEVPNDIDQGAPEFLAAPATLLHLPQANLLNDVHDGHEHLNSWDWGTNVGPYPDLSYNASLTVAHPFAAGPSNAKTLGPLNADPDDGLDDMAYIRSFSDSQNMFYNSQTMFGNNHSNNYQLQNAQTQAFLPHLNDNTYAFSNNIAVQLSGQDYDQHRVTLDADNGNSPLMHITSQIEPPRTKRKSKTLATIQSSSVSTEVQMSDLFNVIGKLSIGAGSGADIGPHAPGERPTQQLCQQELRLNNEDLPVNIGVCMLSGADSGANADVVPQISSETPTQRLFQQELHSSVMTTAIGLSTEDLNRLPAATSVKRTVRTSDTLALLESESDKLQVKACANAYIECRNNSMHSHISDGHKKILLYLTNKIREHVHV